MTISSTHNRHQFAGNGSTTAFPITFAFHNQADLKVVLVTIATGVEVVQVLNSDYQVSGSQDALGHYSSGGTVTMSVAPTSLERLIVYRDPTSAQGLDLQDLGPFPAESVEATLDYLLMLIQRVSDIASRAIRAPEGDAFVGLGMDPIPAIADRASKFLAFDANGGAIVADGTSADLGPVSSFINTLLDDTTAAAARTTLGAVGLTGNETVAGVKTFSSNPVMAGVQFPASQIASGDANCLDDYEEGTWTPSLGGTATYTSRAGAYTKIGREVFVTGRIVVNAIGSGSPSTISGLPFVSAATSFGLGPCRWGGAAVSPVTLNAYNAPGTATLVMVGVTAGGASDGTLGVFGNSADIVFTCRYFI